MAEMSNREEDCITDDFPPPPPPLRMHRQRYGVVGGLCINQGCLNYYPDERECQTCNACAERHCACRPGVQTLPRSKRRRGVSDESAENKRIRGG